jgi:hypothetical protein
MVEKIKISKNEFENRGRRDNERVSEFLATESTYNYFKKYFPGDVLNHNSIRLRNNSLYIYCDVYFNPRVVEEREIGDFKEAVDASEKKRFGPYFDTCWIVSLDEPNLDCIKYICKHTKQELGYYFIALKTLITCDATHVPWGHNYIRKIIRDLVSLKHLKSEKVLKQKRKVNLTLGADPEFEILKNDQVVRADRYFSDKNGNFSCDANCKIGIDGEGGPIELRPKPVSIESVDSFIEEMEGLFQEINELTEKENVTLSTIGETMAIGGHLHVGVNNDQYEPSTKLVKLLDYFIGVPFWDVQGKARGSYKALSSFRSQPWGFEYRTTPATLFSNARITKIAIKILSNVVQKYFDEEEFVLSNEKFSRTAGATHANDFEFKKYAELTPVEICYMYDYIEHHKKIMNDGTPYQEDVLAAWLMQPREKVFSPQSGRSANLEITLNDEWDPALHSWLYDELVIISRQIRKDKKLEQNFHFHLFGLSDRRGDTCVGIEVPGFPFPSDYNLNPPNKQNYSIGLPLSFRKNHLIEEKMDRFKEQIISTFVKELEERLVSRKEKKKAPKKQYYQVPASVYL